MPRDGSTPAPPRADPAVRRARSVANVLDHRLVDPVLGLFLPSVGDVVGALFGFYVIGVALERRLPAIVIARMLINLAVDTAIGVIPIVGDVFDFFFRAHVRNLTLLEARHRDRRARASDWLVVGGAALALVAALVLPVLALVALIAWIF